MKKISLSLLFAMLSTLGFSQVDSTSTEILNKEEQTHFSYPQDFPGNTFRFKPFMVAQSTLSAEYEIYSKSRPSSFVIAFEATLQQTNTSDIVGGGLEIDKRTYFNRSLGSKKNSETMFYISYGAKYNHYEIDYTYYESNYVPYQYDDYYGYPQTSQIYDPIEKSGFFEFNKVSINLKVGVQFVAFKKISIDTNLGTGIRYNSIKDKPETYGSNFTYDAIYRQGIQPTIHFAVGLAN